MANALYDAARQAFLAGGLDLTTLELRVVLLAEGYVPDLAADAFLDVIDGGDVVATSDALTGVSVALGVLDADDPVLIAVTGADVASLVVYASAPTVGGSAYADADAPLICFLDDAVGLPLTPAGGDVTVAWDSGADKILHL